MEQKLTPRVATIGAEWDPTRGALILRQPDQAPHHHEVRDHGTVRNASWILDEFTTIDQGDDVATWLSSALVQDVRLVIPGDPSKINCPVPAMALLHVQPKQSFTAASPVGLASSASLDDLNGRVVVPVSMDPFRMNVIVDGLGAYEEDDITSLSNDCVELINVTPAERCVIITTDQRTGEWPTNNLMQTLRDHLSKSNAERFGSGLKFGNYMAVGRPGTLEVGDRLRAT